jgi:hypothetical protein
LTEIYFGIKFVHLDDEDDHDDNILLVQAVMFKEQIPWLVNTTADHSQSQGHSSSEMFGCHANSLSRALNTMQWSHIFNFSRAK